MTKYARKKLTKVYEKLMTLSYAAELAGNYLDAVAFEETAKGIEVVADEYGFRPRLAKNLAMIRYRIEKNQMEGNPN